MSDKSKIEWCDTTWNPVTGCSPVSDGCKHCYAKRDWARLSANPKTVYFGREFSDVKCHPEKLDLPLRWKKPRRIFVNSMGDLFHPDVPFEFIAAVFAVMASTSRHTFLVLTKRPERMLAFFQWLDLLDEGEWPLNEPPPPTGIVCILYDIAEPIVKFHKKSIPKCHWRTWPLSNVQLGVTAENQKAADERIPLLLQTPDAKRFVSIEPMLGPIDLGVTGALGCNCENDETCSGRCVFYRNAIDKTKRVDWVVAGGESGPKARPLHPDWVRSIRDQCKTAGVPFMFKQHGEWLATEFCDDDTARIPFKRVVYVRPDGSFHDGSEGVDFFGGDEETAWVGKKRAGRMLDGVMHDEYPEGGK
jgi:protein gp37